MISQDFTHQAVQVEREYIEDLNEILAKISPHLTEAGRVLIQKAFRYAYEAHLGRKRYSKEPYFVHCVEVAKILADLKMDALAIAGGLLHDVVEDTNIPIEEIEREFGRDVAVMVDGVTKISELRFESLEERQAANFRKMLLSMSKDIRVIVIKFADRLHNMRTIEFLPRSAQERIARETMEVYAPLAHRFGMAIIKSELEDLSFKVTDYEAYREIASLVAMKKDERDRYIEEVIQPLRVELSRLGIKAKVQGRAKHLYSIYQKIHERGKSFEEILDLLAIRILVDKVEDCYFVLGVVHSLFQPLHEKFADYIAMPKGNMYQSLHTKVRGPGGSMVEVQIRTHKMHIIAEEGIAAHWRYKEGMGKDDDLARHIAWVRQFLDFQTDSASAQDFMDTLRQDLFSDEVFLFTPKGKLINLPHKATPIDFAYAVHTDVGMHCIGAKVNKKIVPLNAELHSGDTVEIITSASQKPSQDWLRFVVSARAKSRIKRWLKISQYQQSIKLGRELLTRELQRLRIKFTNEQIEELARESNFDDQELFFAALGNGDLSLQSVMGRLSAKKVSPSRDGSIFQHMIRRVKGGDEGIKIQGMDDLLITFAECCRPLPGDKITGFITVGKGISVHRIDCKNVRHLMDESNRNIAVDWDVDRDQEFNARVRLLAEDRRHLLHDLTEAISPLEINIIGLDMQKEGSLALGTMVVKVKNLAHLTKLIRRMQNVKGVVSVSRLDEEIDKRPEGENDFT
jgi:GTP pyrophosphokinase